MVDYSLYGMPQDNAQIYRDKLMVIYGESVLHLISSQRTVNKDNIMKYLVREIERQPEDIQKYYRVALETVGVHAR
ncbi:Uncharacterised protein [Serratia rubidaea]|uniref:Uncharacterized protein n=1 Tax=Serratia rubidaea TaxID=61652 RepID=A0A448SVC2_SERRU|nr:hypothetical protein [Serratia rubidaea]AML59051.1 hypothetical protein AXX16_3356 [Serratia rubidaea]MBD8451609.1 hypothetical protein [Serratia rubidaea]MBH1928719.1 hypothetical protein [Serratia rubidaea]MBS0971869.1 hypothetical protein [Serratia rubidaea]MCR0998700.1 hypothetical protein [Serratia rubidaea]